MLTLYPIFGISRISKKGRLYNWETAKKACPKGWHLPNNAEWDKLLRFVDGDTGTESPYNNDYAYGRSMIYYREYAHWYYSDKSNLYSVRYVKD